MTARAAFDPLEPFHPAVRAWFSSVFDRPTRAQVLGWPAIARGDSTLILAPTGSGKTLAAFLWCLDRLMFQPAPQKRQRCRIVYVSPLKALAVDIERNLRDPLSGIARMADSRGNEYLTPTIAVRTGDTSAADRARFQREPADILITTPESLYLLLTSNARDALQAVETIILDEIHALVPTKRGAHLAVSVERLAARLARPLQRIGLSATQRPLDEVARFLGGAERSVRKTRHTRRAGTMSDAYDDQEINAEIASEFSSHDQVRYRPVTIVDAGSKKPLMLAIEVPVEDMARLQGSNLAAPENVAAPEGRESAATPSIWSAIHPRLLELIRGHRSTLIFVNSRRLAERLAGALNELAGETLVRSHHGSIARAQRTEVEDLLKGGALRALVATSSLELGIDMGAIDLVVQIEAPPSVASGLQRIGRSGHHIDAVSQGVIFPKFRGDLVACAAVAHAMHTGSVEATRYPRNPLDIATQQIVAMVAMDEWTVDDLLGVLRSAAPFADLGRSAFESVLDMLSGRYPSDEFAELRPRITWDRIAGLLTTREGAKRVAVANGGTIPDRGLYGVFLASGTEGAGLSRRESAVRVGELDEEMVFESRVGETFVLGASTWRIEEITHDRVIVSPAPGEPGKMPFWKGERAGRPLELGLAIGRLTHDLLAVSPAAAVDRLTRQHDLDRHAAENLLQYLREQQAADGVVPDATTMVIERVRDDLGDWRVCVLSPRGGPIHAPWAMAAAAKIRESCGINVQTLWGDDGFVVRFPDVDQPPDPSLLLPDPEEVQPLVIRELGATALFAGKFRENAARSLLLPKRRPGMRAPLWQQRKRAADLLAVASRYGSFPVLLETYRECLRDFFDLPALISTMADVRSGKIRVVTVNSEHPSPFAASLLFSYVASFLYDGDAPLAERRAQALSVDQAQLRDLLGDAELRELLDQGALDDVARQLQRLDAKYHARSPDQVHDLLLAIGDLTADELRARTATPEIADSIDALVRAGRALRVQLGGEARYIAIEDAARYRDALDMPVPPGIPESLLEAVRDPLGDLAHRYARTHVPFTAQEFAARYKLAERAAEAVLVRLTAEGRLLEGEFCPGGTRREWTDADVLRMIRRRSLATLRHEIEPVEPEQFGRFLMTWHGIVKRRRGADALVDAIEQLQGAPLPASILETEILPARIDRYDSADLDAVMAAGEVVWVGVEPLGERDGRVALYLADHLPRLLRPTGRRRADTATAAHQDSAAQRDFTDRESAIIDCLRTRGASFFGPLHQAVGGGYPGEMIDALWTLVWRGLITNDTFHSLRAFTRSQPSRRRVRRPDMAASFRSRRLVPPSAEGRWSLVQRPEAETRSRADARIRQLPGPASTTVDATAWAAATAQQLLARHGVLTREAMAVESVAGGFGVMYPVLKAMEETGRVRRGYFVAGLGGAQFASAGALDLLRSLSDRVHQDVEVAALAATDPANPYGATLKWPGSVAHQQDHQQPSTGRGPTRSVGATVILADGALAAYLGRGDRLLLTWLPDSEPLRSRIARAVSQALIDRARTGGDTPRGMLIEEIDGGPSSTHTLAPFLIEAGFIAGAMGMQAKLKI